MPVVFASLMCHAPIVVPAVGGGRALECKATTRAMREAAARLVHARPDRVVVISPHSPRRRHRWSARPGPHIGDFSRFGAPQVRMHLPDAPEVAHALHLPPVAFDEPLDHGSSVPLGFVMEQGWSGPTAILAQPWSQDGAEAIGRALRDLPGRTAVLASGDMSHRLQRGAPAGYHPDAKAFDAAFVRALAAGDWSAALAAPHRADAAEDVITSTAVAMAAADPLNDEVLAYEGPFGVGYCEAILHDPEPPLWAVARRAVEAAARGGKCRIPSGGPPSAGVFVSLHREGHLRGCIGHVTPARAHLYQEVAEVARLAATADPRMPSISADELVDLDIEVSVLEPPMPCSQADLDPRTYGVVIEHADGRRGLLLPDLDGIDTAAQQVSIARRKGGIGPGEPVNLSRFVVTTQERP